MLSFLKNIAFLSLKIVSVLANIADTDEMPHNAAFNLGLRCFQNTHLESLAGYTVNSEILARILFSRIALIDIFGKLKFATRA